jgi:hypothetical protein
MSPWAATQTQALFHRNLASESLAAAVIGLVMAPLPAVEAVNAFIWGTDNAYYPVRGSPV